MREFIIVVVHISSKYLDVEELGDIHREFIYFGSYKV